MEVVVLCGTTQRKGIRHSFISKSGLLGHQGNVSRISADGSGNGFNLIWKAVEVSGSKPQTRAPQNWRDYNRFDGPAIAFLCAGRPAINIRDKTCKPNARIEVRTINGPGHGWANQAYQHPRV